MILLGIDIGGTSVKTALLEDGRPGRLRKSPTYERPSTRQIVEAIADATSDLHAVPDAIGICCPGLLDRPGRKVTLSVNVPGIVGVPLDQLAVEALGRLGALPPVSLLTDAAAMAADLHAHLALPGRLFCLTLGTGVGASVVDPPLTFLEVSGLSPGHFGQLDVSLDDDAPLGPDGGRGSLEAYIGAGALQRRFGPQDAAELLTMDDPAIRALVRAIRIAHAIYRPQHVALAGGLGVRLRHLLAPLREAVAHQLTSVARAGWTMLAGEDDHHAARGAARWAGRERE